MVIFTVHMSAWLTYTYTCIFNSICARAFIQGNGWTTAYNALINPLDAAQFEHSMFESRPLYGPAEIGGRGGVPVGGVMRGGILLQV